jgi:DNA-binding XRE family transcriptional regulator
MSSSEIPKDIEMYYDFCYQLAVCIFDYRTENNLSKDDFAKMVGVSRNTISRLESGCYNGSLNMLCKVLTKIGYELVIKSK